MVGVALARTALRWVLAAIFTATLLVNVAFLLSQQNRQRQTKADITIESLHKGHLNDKLSHSQQSKSRSRSGDNKNTTRHTSMNRWSDERLRRAVGSEFNESTTNSTTIATNYYTKSSSGDTTIARSTKSLSVRVLSSKERVLIEVNGAVVYESASVQPQDASDFANKKIARSTVASGKQQILYERERKQQTNYDNKKTSYDEQSIERGIHLLVLNQYNGRVMARRIFDTYTPRQDDELCLFVQLIPEGRVLVFGVRDEATFRMGRHSAARHLLTALGSRHITKLAWRDTWAMITIKRLDNQDADDNNNTATAVAEAMGRSRYFDEWGPPVQVEARVPLAIVPSDRWPDGTCAVWHRTMSGVSNLNIMDESKFQTSMTISHSENQSNIASEIMRRAQFCGRYDGYGSVCDCDTTINGGFKNWRPTTTLNNLLQLANVPVIVMASNRPYYLFRMLSTLLAADGVNTSLVTVHIDGFYDEPLAVAHLFALHAVQHEPRGRKSARISQHYRASLAATFRNHPKADYVIIIEEDLDVARDFFIYFNATIPILRRDPTLFCASAWNDQGYEHTARDTRLIYRVESMPGLGWCLSRQVFQQELEPRWPSADRPHDWDMWLRTPSVRAGRECLVPDVSRTYHFGARGMNMNAYFQSVYFSKHAFYVPTSAPNDEPAFTGLENLTNDTYERHIEQLLIHARVYNRLLSTSNSSAAAQQLCSLSDDVPQIDNNSHHVYNDYNQNNVSVIFIQMIGDHNTWLQLAKCWHIWDLDVRGHHNSMWRLFLGSMQTLVVGVPASPYSRFMPPDIEPFRFLE